MTDRQKLAAEMIKTAKELIGKDVTATDRGLNSAYALLKDRMSSYVSRKRAVKLALKGNPRDGMLIQEYNTLIELVRKTDKAMALVYDIASYGYEL